MKTKRFDRKLNLNKKTVSNLAKGDMGGVKGGGATYNTCYYTCESCDTRLNTCLPCPDIQTEYETCYTGWCC